VKYDALDFTPPAGVRTAFKRGLALHAAGKSGDGLVPATVAWATRIAAGDPVTPEKARKGRAWHARHAVDEREGWGTPGSETPGYVAFMLWGGAPGRAWFNKLGRQMDAADNAQESTMNAKIAGLAADRARAVAAAMRATEATYPIREGETLEDFSRLLGQAAKDHLALAFSDALDAMGWSPDMEDEGMEDPDFRFYTEGGTLPDSVVMEAYRDHPYTCVYLRMPYGRDADGMFTFGDPTVVDRKVVYDEAPDGSVKLAAFIGANLPGVEAVASPGITQRRNLPAAAFAAPFFADEEGNYSPDAQRFMRSKSALPFHVNSAQSVDSMTTVDVPRLRAALSRFDQTDFTRFGSYAATVKAKARKLLDAAAKALLPTAKAAATAGESACARLVGAPTVAEVGKLCAAYEAFAVATLPDRAAEAVDQIRAAIAPSGNGVVISAKVIADLQKHAAALATEATAANVAGDQTGELRVVLGHLDRGAFYAINAQAAKA
jgi:hypothetical protein